nr:MAG TPA: hypothetical protein [Caudoviricetes sp.]
MVICLYLTRFFRAANENVIGANEIVMNFVHLPFL